MNVTKITFPLKDPKKNSFAVVFKNALSMHSKDTNNTTSIAIIATLPSFAFALRSSLFPT